MTAYQLPRHSRPLLVIMTGQQVQQRHMHAWQLACEATLQCVLDCCCVRFVSHQIGLIWPQVHGHVCVSAHTIEDGLKGEHGGAGLPQEACDSSLEVPRVFCRQWTGDVVAQVHPTCMQPAHKTSAALRSGMAVSNPPTHPLALPQAFVNSSRQVAACMAGCSWDFKEGSGSWYSPQRSGRCCKHA
jgi:hypothetical protein